MFAHTLFEARFMGRFREGSLRENDVHRLIRYRNRAEELRIIAGERLDPKDCETLLRIAADYDQMAATLEELIKSRHLVPTTILGI
jgi:hypothetical protein